MAEPCVEIEGVTKRFGEDLVLKEVNLGHGEREGLRHCGKQRFRQDRSHEVYLRVPAAQLRHNPGLWKKDRRGPGFSGVSRL